MNGDLIFIISISVITSICVYKMKKLSDEYNKIKVRDR